MRIFRLTLNLIVLALCAAAWISAYSANAGIGLALWLTLSLLIVTIGPFRFLRFLAGVLQMVGAIG